MVLVADRKHERRQQSSASVIKFVSAHRFVDVPHQDCPPTAARNLALFECVFNSSIIDASASPLPNVFLPLYNNSVTGVRFECSRLRTMVGRMRATTRTNSTSVRKLPVLIASFCSSLCISEPELTLSSTTKNHLPR